MKLAVLTNILTPYRIPYFHELGKLVDSMTVVLMAESHRDRDWVLDQNSLECITLSGVHWSFPRREVPLHVNFGTIGALKKIDPDIVMSGGFAPANIAGFLYCKLYRKRHICWGELSFGDGAQSSIARRAIRRLLSTYSDGTVASSSRSLECFEHYGASTNKGLVTSIPIDFKDFSRKASQVRAEFSARVGGSAKPPVILSVSRLVKEKGVDLLIQMYERLLPTFPGLQLWIVGDGPYRTYLEGIAGSVVSGNVTFFGFLQKLAVIEKMALADLFVFPSLRDTFGVVLLEAMACRTLSVSSIHAYGTHDLIEEGVTGYTIDPMDIDGAVAQISKALSLGEKVKEEIVNAAYARASEAEAAQCAEQTIEFLSGLS